MLTPAQSTNPISSTPIPENPSDYVVFAAMHPDLALPPLPGITDDDFEFMKTAVTKAMNNGRNERIVSERMRNCFDCIGAGDAFIQHVLSI